jgi:hypothetical protein
MQSGVGSSAALEHTLNRQRRSRPSELNAQETMFRWLALHDCHGSDQGLGIADDGLKNGIRIGLMVGCALCSEGADGELRL